MSAAEKFKEMSDSQLMDFMRCNPGAAAKAFGFWRLSHTAEGQSRVEYKDRVVVEQRVVYKDVPREVKVPSLVNRGLAVAAGVAGVLCVIFIGESVRLAGINDTLVAPVAAIEYRDVVVKEVPSDYEELKTRNHILRGRIDTQAETIRVLQEAN